MCGRRGRTAFQPNRLLEVTPKFFERVIRGCAAPRSISISLDEMHRRLDDGRFPRRRFVCVTFDDGYRDNREFAYPVLKKYEVPFAIYVRDELRRPHRRAVVARARSRDRAERHDRGCDSTAATAGSSAAASSDKREVFDHIYCVAAPASDRGGAARRRCAICARATASTCAAFCDDLCMDLGRDRRRSPPIRW